MKTAVVLFNLGGPDGPDAVEPFLRNLFSDRAIINLPAVLRKPLAGLIARRRAVIARGIYANLGGASPIFQNTQAQAQALEKSLGDRDVQIFVAMRYWRPFARDVAQAVKAFAPDQIVLLPLYPQFSTTTTGSSVADWRNATRAIGFSAPTVTVCCYPTEAGFTAALAERIRPILKNASAEGRPRLLFSAHGLPKRIVASGDPYQWQVEQTAAAVVARLDIADLDWLICYQSRVGPLQWIGPATEAEIRRAGAEKVSVVICPIAFVSEHSETLVELDIEYRQLADEAGCPAYRRVPTVDAETHFIAGLADLVRRAIAANGRVTSENGGRLCPAGFQRCLYGAGAPKAALS